MSNFRPHTASLLALGPRPWSGSHDQERDRRRRQIERGVIRATEVGHG